MLPPLGGYQGPFKSLSEAEIAVRSDVKKSVSYLAGNLGERNIATKENLNAAAEYITSCFATAGLEISEQSYLVNDVVVKNIIGEKKGKKNEILVIGAHYDSVNGSPGADDNASGVAAVIAIANLMKAKKLNKTIRFVTFCTEEPPFFSSQQMGSWQYAKAAKAKQENIVGMFSIESIGYYALAKNSQRYPMFLGIIYPDRADFIGFVANLSSRGLLRKALASFRRNSQFPSQGISAPTVVIPGVSWSDQWSFWEMGYKAIMITDTAPYRNPYYHTAHDLPGTLDYDRTARVVYGLMLMLNEFADQP